MRTILGLLLILAAGIAHAETSSSAGQARLLLDGTDVVNDSDRPRACLTFNRDLDLSGSTPIEAYLRLEPAADVGYSARRNLLCIDGLQHGVTYTLTLLDGLPGVDARLEGDRTVRLPVADRTPLASFPGTGFVLPRIDTAGLPVETVNIEQVALRLYRINDRALVGEIRNGLVFGGLYQWAMEDLADSSGELVWQGTMAIDAVANRTVRTAIPIDETIGTLEPGIYAVAALDQREIETDWPDWASQWFIVSDLGMATYLGSTGLDVTVRSLADGTPVAGAEIALYARNSALLGTAVTDGDGLARFAAGLTRGTGGNAPRVAAASLDGDFAFLDLAAGTLDLSDRGVEGRLPPGPLDAFLYSERGIYRPGETANVVALLRDDDSVAVTGLSLILRVLRPDGIEVDRHVVADTGQGSHPLSIALPPNAYTGRWTVEALADPESPAIGTVSFLVDDFVPPRIEFDLAADPAILVPGPDVAHATVDADYLYGGVAAGLEGGITLGYAAARDPFGRNDGFQFGRAEENLAATDYEEIAFVTDEAGEARVPLDLSAMPVSTSPVAVAIHAQIFDVGGRPVGRDAEMIVLPTPVLIGVRPTFDDYVRQGQEAAFEVAAFDRDGNRIALDGLQWDLVRESYDWRWWDDGGNWNYRGFLWDELVGHGMIDAGTDGLARIAPGLDWGRYRLEVYDPESGAATSVRFRTGWSRTPLAGDTPPDRVTVTLGAERYAPGDTATVFIDPPFDAEVALGVMDNGVRALRFVHVPEEGAEITLDVTEDWAPGAYVVATAYGAPDPLVPSIPQRAVGVAWMSVERPGDRLDVTIDAPAEIEPERTLEVAVSVDGVADGSAFVTLAAVDDGILQLTRYTAPDSEAFFLGQRRLGVELGDLYGRLIDASGAMAGAVRSGGDSPGGFGDALAKRSSKVVSLFSGIVPVVDGTARIPLALPDFNGRLRLMAVAWSAGGVGAAEATITVAAPLVADLVLPRFLAPGDIAQASLAIDNRKAVEGGYTFRLIAEGPVRVLQPAAILADLQQGDRVAAAFRLEAEAIGVARMTLLVTGPDDHVQERSWDLTVRATNPLTTERRIVALPPGTSYLLTTALTDGYDAGGLAMTLTADSVPPIDTATLLRWLYLYPYGCAEQTTSTALPLLYAAALDADGVLRTTPEELSERVDDAIARLSAMQAPDGDFGLWSWRGDRSAWLTAYVTDFLSRARELGHEVPDTVLLRAYDALEAAVYDDSAHAGGRAYALHVLARNGEGDAYDLAYAADRLARNGPSWIARALLAAAFAELGDPVRARELVPDLAQPGDEGFDYPIWGSGLRNAAMAGALLVETGLASPEQRIAIARSISRSYDDRDWTSTQEKAWLVIAANGLKSGVPVSAQVGDAPLDGTGPVELPLPWPPEGGALLVRSTGTAPLYLSLSWSGYPLATAPARVDGFTIARDVYDMKGNPIDATALHQNDRVVVVLSFAATDPGQHQAMVVDLLPAGLELENARLEGAIETGDLAWLPELAQPMNVELRDDRYVAALELRGRDGVQHLAYIVRAVTPGRYVVPAPYVEDMYRPYLFARGEAGRLDVSVP